MKIGFFHNRLGRRAGTGARTPGACRTGFTLLELVVVLAIVLVVTLVAVGGYANLRKGRSVRTAAEAVQALLVGARAYAITTNGHYRVVIQMRNPSTGQEQTSYWIDEIYPSDAEVTTPNPAVPEAAKTPKITTPELLPEDVDLADVEVVQVKDPGISTKASPETTSYAVIRFFPDGSSDGATVRLVRGGALTADNNPRAYVIRLVAPTAKARIASAERI